MAAQLNQAIPPSEASGASPILDAGVTDVGRLIDEARFSPLQIRVVALCGLASILDGIDTQSIGIAAPELAKFLSLTPAGPAPVFSAGLLGALTGALGLGTLADHVGRKQVLILSTVIFGLFSLLTVLVTSFETLLVLRFLAGLGLGGAAPCFTALAAEYTPARKRPLIIGVMWASFPLGGMTGAFLLATFFTAAVGQMPDYPGLTIAAAFFSGLFLGCGGVGVIALATVFYPTLVRSTGLGWGLAVGRGGQVRMPLVTGAMLRGGMGANEIFLVLGMLPVLAAVAVLLLSRDKKRLSMNPTLNVAAH